MKAEITTSEAGWITIRLIAETPVDATRLVRMGMNGSAETNKVMTVYANDDGIAAWVSLEHRRDRSYQNKGSAVTRIKHQKG